MIFGMTTLTFVHTVISLIGIAWGFAVMSAMLRGRSPATSTAVFLVSTVLTSVTGFFFPFFVLLPSHKIGVLSLVVLAVAIAALKRFRPAMT